MIRKLLFTPTRNLLYTKQVARLSELNKYVCLRESLNEGAAQRAQQEFQELAKKYKLESGELIQLVKLVKSEPELSEKFLHRPSYITANEDLQHFWRSTSFYAPGVTIEKAIEELKNKYPEVVSFEGRQAERAQALETLESIFIRNGPKLRNLADNAAVSKFLPEFLNRINGHLVELRNTNKESSDTINEITSTLNHVYALLQANPAETYGKIRHYIAAHRGQTGELQTIEPQETLVQTLEERSVSRIPDSEFETITGGNDIPLLVEEHNKLLRKRLGYNFLPWINDRKLVFEAQPDRANHYIFGALAAVFGTYFLYKLFQGDAHNVTLVASLAVAGFCFTRYRIATIRNGLDYLVQMNIHRDGRSLDLFIKRANNKVDKIEGVPVSEFKLHRGDYDFNFKETPLSAILAKNNALTRPGFRLSDLRYVGAANGSWVATYGQNTVFVPMNYNGNTAVLDNIFRGKNLELNA